MDFMDKVDIESKDDNTNNQLHKIVIIAKSFGDYSGTEIYLTPNLYSRLETEKAKRDNTPILKLLEKGRAVQGLKHLVTVIKEKNKETRIIFCTDNTRKLGKDYYINYDGYRKTGQSRFFGVYRETGLDTANFYLNKYFPDCFDYSANSLKESEVRKVQKQLPDILNRVSNQGNNQVAVLQGANKVLKTKLKRKSKKLQDAVSNLRLQTNLEYYQGRLNELMNRLNSGKNYHETKGKESWQAWIHHNNWLFGINYLNPIPQEKVGFDNIPDYLFPTRDGFLDILEIKKPNPTVIEKDEDHADSYVWSKGTNLAIGQVVTYIQKMEDHRLEIRDRINEKYGSEYGIVFHVIKPRAFVLIGNSSDWSSKQKEALKRLNYSLHGIEVLTYTDLIKRGESIIAMLESEISPTMP
jgi:hypothetical protein